MEEIVIIHFYVHIKNGSYLKKKENVRKISSRTQFKKRRKKTFVVLLFDNIYIL